MAERFCRFCRRRARQNIDVMAGIAPGLDFNFAELEKQGMVILLAWSKKLNN